MMLIDIQHPPTKSRSITIHQQKTTAMIKHYFKIALRNLGRQKILSFINVLGLSIGLGCFALFLLYAVNEFNFDRFHKMRRPFIVFIAGARP